MTVQTLSLVHQRYVGVSGAFKSAWTFHQFVQGLGKVFPDDGLPAYDADFQGVYGRLKGVSHNLNELGAEVAEGQLDGVEEELAELNEALLGTDARIRPARLRQFFQRIRNYDDEILSQLVKFYLYTHTAGSSWAIDRMDKADFLVTKLCEEYNETHDSFGMREPQHLRELASGLWSALDDDAVGTTEIEASIGELDALRHQILAVESIDALSQEGLVQRLRELKHSFGSTYFHPRVLVAVVETNLAAKNRVQEMYRREEERIVAEYQQIFDLEREVPLDSDLRRELEQFRTDVERFEKQLQGANIRLEELANLRRRVRELLPRLKDSTETSNPVFVSADMDLDEGPEQASASEGLSPEYAFVEETYQRLVTVLEGINPSHEPKRVTLDPSVFGYGLEQREVVAFRRLRSGEPAHRHTETLIIRAAALRVMTEELAQEIKSILDDTAVTRNAPVFRQAREATRFADLLIHRFSHQIEQVLMDGELDAAQSLQLLKMRLMRTYSGLWLMIYRP